MAFVYEDSSSLVNAISVGSTGADAHENHASLAMKPKIHPSLEADAFLLTHLYVRYDVPRLDQLNSPSIVERITPGLEISAF